ncbi:sugar ABC transporter permease [Blautia liquoris]|uniref:Sugar ABC transporter permease n=1 Tax=Blautia liquoris TaxID=2779518 RepID=A0A7M2RHC4_9FIRM|nr:sugar ABC transporter permease [Blautia liquoris]QOV18740.1 sugar ABC transporter permease [Blautia liquoris]HBN05747.1 sugar ABC transporter permease [Bacteroidales bacterium]
MKNVKMRIRLFYMLPAMAFFIGLVIIPVGMSLYNSFFEWNGINTKIFIGLGNFKELIKDKQISGALINTLKLTFASTFFQLPIGMVIALLVTGKKTKFKGLFQSVYFLPVILSSSIVGILWTQIYEPNLGLVNLLLEKLGLERFQHAWLGEPQTALYAVIFVMLWFYVGNYVLIYYGALESIPSDILEYSELDGVPPVTKFFKIQLPLIWPTIQLTTMLVVVNSLRYFDLIYIMTKGGPNHSTDVLATVIVREAFDSMRFGYGSAISMFLFLLGTIFIVIINRLMKKESVY